jgi:hypothetical protein
MSEQIKLALSGVIPGAGVCLLYYGPLSGEQAFYRLLAVSIGACILAFSRDMIRPVAYRNTS